MELNLDGEGFLRDREDWNPEVAMELANRDGVALGDEHMRYISEARRMFEEDSVVPPIRRFSKEMGVSTKELYSVFEYGPMKQICKWGGLPKPTGCV